MKVRVILAGQSNAVPFTDSRTVPSDYLATGSLAWTSIAISEAAPTVKRSPWRPIRIKKGPPGDRPFIGIDAAIAKRLIDLGHSPSIVQVAMGSTSLGADWLPPSGYAYIRLLREIGHAVASTRCPAADASVFVWIQGESDVDESDAFVAAYQSNLAALVAGLRAQPGAGADMRCTIVQLNTQNTGGTSQRRSDLRAAQAAFVAADGKSAIVDPSDLSLYDGAHYFEAGSIEVGERCADAIDGLL